MPRWPPPTYRLSMEFDVPMTFAYRWCTDYRTDDGRRAGEPYERRVLKHDRTDVVIEDLWWEPRGWGWRRSEIRLSPPDRWHATSFGNVRDAAIDYRLRPLPGDRTGFELTMHRRPSSSRPEQPAKATFERYLRTMWSSLHRAMVRDYRATSRRRLRTSRGRVQRSVR